MAGQGYNNRRGLGLGEGAYNPRSMTDRQPYSGGARMERGPYQGGARYQTADDGERMGDRTPARDRDPGNYDDYGDVYPTDSYGSVSATVNEQRNSDFKHRTRTKDDDWSPRDYGYERREHIDPIHDELHDLPGPTGPDDEDPYWDKSRKSTDELFAKWREKLKAKGLSDEEIDEIMNDVVSLHD